MILTKASLRNEWGYANDALLTVLENNSVYKYDATSTAADDDDTVIRPVMTDEGRWLKQVEYVISNMD